MAGIWSRKFDYKNGEDRVCKKCNETFHATKPLYTCTKCQNANQKILSKQYRDKIGRKPYYPFDNKGTESSNRFCSIRTALSKAWKEFEKTGDKSIVVAHYEKQLKEIHENGIWEWIWDRRDDETIKARSVKSKEMIRKDLPDTRGYYEY